MSDLITPRGSMSSYISGEITDRSFKEDLNAAQNMVKMIKDMKNLELENADNVKQLICQNGLMLFKDISDELETNSRGFDKKIVDKDVQNGDQNSKVKVI